MPKGGTLTGGTGDVNPQWYKLQVPNGIFLTTTAVQSASATQAYPLPVSRLKQAASGKTTVIEVLKVRWMNQLQLAANQAPHNAIYTVQSWLSTRAPNYIAAPAAFSPFDPTDGAIVDQASTVSVYGVDVNGQINAASFDNEGVNDHDLTDGDGHGILIATDNIWVSLMLTVASADVESYSANGYSTCWILYRFKDVSLTEYIGMVQSQQGQT